MANEILHGQCHICGNVSSYDKGSLEGSTWRINGVTVVLCIPCEDDLLKKIAKGRGLFITYTDGGEISQIKVNKSIKVIQ
jgi:uncharacterized protein YlaI